MMKRTKNSGFQIKTYLVGEFITREGWEPPSYLEHYEYMDSEEFKNALNSKEGLIEWVSDKYDQGEAERFLCEILKVDSLGKVLDALDSMSEEKIKKEVLPLLVKKFEEPLDWKDYFDTEIADFSPFATAALELREELPDELLIPLGIDIDDSEYYAQMSSTMDIDKANKILEERGINIRFK